MGGTQARPSRADPPGVHPVWSRDFGLFFAARAVAQLGDSMLPVALAAGLLQHGHGAGAVGLALAATSAAFAGLIIFGGVVADRFNTRKLMVGADLVRVGTQSPAAALFFSGHVVLWQICAIGFVNGVAAAVFQPGVAGTVPRLAKDVQGANGAIPLVATEVVQRHGPGAYGLINSALGAGTVLGGLLALRLRPRRMLRAGAIALFAFAGFPVTVGAGLDVAAMAAGAAVAGAGMAFWSVMWATSVQTQVPADVLNRIHAYDVAGSLAMMPVGQALAGPAAATLGADRVFLVAGGMSLVVVGALLSVRAIRDLVRVDSPTTLRSVPAETGESVCPERN
ncbi:MFS transporter [Streptomyces viridochromogenes]|uniref:MFS transporter n=1 Tax=Streptomyces viridochromogenes TaxID=1938 RepID=A0A0J8CE09_STRVR|nr:MFS transporter [Streptomyces viridochromogenes]KMS76175.1 MFS transporter [Streptomyces viridochromogenes]